jgi:hypothetical protein
MIGGISTLLIGFPLIINKSDLTNAGLLSLDRNNFTYIDHKLPYNDNLDMPI